MYGFADFFIVSVDDLELEILNDLKSKKRELFFDIIDELISIDELIYILKCDKETEIINDEIV